MTIQVLRKHGLSLRKIADEVGCAVNTVRRYLAVESPRPYQRTRRKPTKLRPFHSYLAERRKRPAAPPMQLGVFMPDRQQFIDTAIGPSWEFFEGIF